MTSEAPAPPPPSAPSITVAHDPPSPRPRSLALGPPPELFDLAQGPERLHRALAVLAAHHRRSGKGSNGELTALRSSGSAWREALLAEFELRLLEGAMLEREIAAAREWLASHPGLGANDDGLDLPLVASNGCTTSARAVHDWIIEQAPLEVVRWIVLNEIATRPGASAAAPSFEATSDSEAAAVVTSGAIEPGPALDRSADFAGAEPCWEALALRNLLIGLDQSPWHRELARGAGAAAASWAARMTSCLRAALDRLGPAPCVTPVCSLEKTGRESAPIGRESAPIGRESAPCGRAGCESDWMRNGAASEGASSQDPARILGQACFLAARMRLHARYAERMMAMSGARE